MILLSTAFLMLKKSEEKQNIVSWIVITTVLLLCYNVAIAYILNIFKIPVSLISVEIINIVISIIIFFYIFKTKNKQKYYVHKRDCLAVLAIIIICICVSIKNFGFPLNIKYIMTDAAVHYKVALNFYDETRLLNNSTDEHINVKTMMPGAYVNTGLLFKMCDGFVDRLDFYKLFIGFDIFLLILSALMLYVTLINLTKNWRMYLCAFILTIIYAFRISIEQYDFWISIFTYGNNNYKLYNFINGI